VSNKVGKNRHLQQWTPVDVGERSYPVRRTTALVVHTVTWLRDEEASSEVVSFALTVGRRSSWRCCLAALATFWPHKDAQRCRLLRTSEYRLGRSAAEWAGSGCALHNLRIRW